MFDFLKNNPLAVAAKGARLRPRSMIFHLLIFFVVMTVTDIASALSFDTPNYFTKTFKRIAGTTPMAYRRTKRAAF